MFSVGDTVCVCWDGKIGRAKKGSVLKTIPRHGKKRRVLVEFYAWGEEDALLMRRWFIRTPAHIERERPYRDRCLDGFIEGRRKLGRIPIVWRKGFKDGFCWNAHYPFRYKEQDNGWYFLFKLNRIHQMGAEERNRFWFEDSIKSHIEGA